MRKRSKRRIELSPGNLTRDLWHRRPRPKPGKEPLKELWVNFLSFKCQISDRVQYGQSSPSFEWLRGEFTVFIAAFQSNEFGSLVYQRKFTSTGLDCSLLVSVYFLSSTKNFPFFPHVNFLLEATLVSDRSADHFCESPTGYQFLLSFFSFIFDHSDNTRTEQINFLLKFRVIRKYFPPT